jgi:AraC family transcriptional regulator of adaptative response/methylated-DNA-[protein]-cysteine methyltransferase
MLTAPADAPATGPGWKWRAVAERDAEADGAFVFAVRTTGVYCRPSCPSRRARPENIFFFDLAREAEAAGFRPCKRCRPTELSLQQARALAIEAACRTIEAAETPPSLSALAEAAGLSRYHFHRTFRAVTGVTPKAYAGQVRERRAAATLRDSGGVTRAIYDAGYDSASRFYDGAKERLGMAPKTFRRGGEGEAIRSAIAESSLGLVLVAATERGICAVRFGDDQEALEAELHGLFPKARHLPADRAFSELARAVIARIEQPEAALELPLDIQGTLFEQRVWAALRAIPTGETRSYGAVAAAIGQPTAARAVARACAANPVAVLTPCHRVVPAVGGLGGYRWGSARKGELLRREGAGK